MEPHKSSPLVTLESVSAAAEVLTNGGQRPSVRSVIGLLGGGSPNAVLPHLQTWKNTRPSVRGAELTLDPRILSILGNQIASAVHDATRSAEARVADLESDANAVAEAGRLAEARVDELVNDLARVQAESQQQTGRLDALTVEVEQVKKEAAHSIGEARLDASREREAAEAARQALARAELRLESLPRLEAELAELKIKLEEERMGRTLAEKMQAVTHAELLHLQSENQLQVSRLDAHMREKVEMKRELETAVAAARETDKLAAVARAQQQAAERRAEDFKEDLQRARQPVAEPSYPVSTAI